MWCVLQFGTIHSITKREKHLKRGATFSKKTSLHVFLTFCNRVDGPKLKNTSPVNKTMLFTELTKYICIKK